MRILLLHTWLANVGNRFVQKGAIETIERAFPDAELLAVDGYPAYRPNLFLSSRRTTLGQRVRRKIRGPEYDADRLSETVLNLLDIFDGDVAALPGCTLYEPALRDYRQTFRELDERGIPYVLLGAGGGDYEATTRAYVRSVFEETTPAALITRDATAYEAYAETVPYAHDGIDCAFFIDDWYDPPAAEEPLVAATFDKIDEPDIEHPHRLVRPSHYHPGYASRAVSEHVSDVDAFISDSIDEYLLIYANATETHADRVHACIPSLVYGNRTRLYIDTPRAKLFDGLVDGPLRDRLVSIDRQGLERAKSAQIDALREAIRRAT